VTFRAKSPLVLRAPWRRARSQNRVYANYSECAQLDEFAAKRRIWMRLGFGAPNQRVQNSVGRLGKGIDVRGDGGYAGLL
jgi:hypothetical protein